MTDLSKIRLNADPSKFLNAGPEPSKLTLVAQRLERIYLTARDRIGVGVIVCATLLFLLFLWQSAFSIPHNPELVFSYRFFGTLIVFDFFYCIIKDSKDRSLKR